MTSALETSGLGKRYGRGLWALRHCDVALPQGTITALVGPNGAGKTTLLHLAIGLIRPTEGEVSLFGEPARMDRPAGLARVGFVAQEHPLYRGFSVEDMLRYGRSLNPSWDQQFAQERMEQLGISLSSRAGKLSGGQQAQLALTLALAKRPRLLVLDEPVASLDPLGRRDFMRSLVDAVASTDLTVVLSSHVVAELERVCDHLILLAPGQVQIAGSIDELVGDHRIIVAAPDQEPALGEGVVARTGGSAHARLLIRNGPGLTMDPRWQTHPVGLEDLVLGYLEASSATGVTVSPANGPG